MILSALIMNGIESDASNVITSWEGIEGTPFTKISLAGDKKGSKKYLYLHRTTKQIFTQNPLISPETEAAPSK